MIKIKIEISERTARHLQSPHTFYNECGEACNVLIKVQKEIDKKLKK